MTRYEIQEMVSQTDRGVTFLALDKESNREVALRRFFAQGQIGQDLTDTQLNSYLETVQRLKEVHHPALRAVIDGGVDDMDNAPFMVTEWIEGQCLSDILGGQTMGVAHTVDVVRTALEVSLALSEASGEQGVWVDTRARAIVVDPQEGGRGYTFWVCPNRWLGIRGNLREVRSVASLAEELTGWNKRVYTGTSGGGFGAWVMEMKASPDISVRDALKRLYSAIGQAVPEPDSRPAAESAAGNSAPTTDLRQGMGIPGASMQDNRPGAGTVVRPPHPEKPAVTRAPQPASVVAPRAAEGVAGSLRAGSQALIPPTKPKASPGWQPAGTASFSALSTTKAGQTSAPLKTTAVGAKASKDDGSKLPMIIIAGCALAVVALAAVAINRRGAREGELVDERSTRREFPGTHRQEEVGPTSPATTEVGENASEPASQAPPPQEEEGMLSHDPAKDIGKEAPPPQEEEGVLSHDPAKDIGIEAPAPQREEGVLSPQDFKDIARMTRNAPVRLQGQVKSIQVPPDSRCIRIEFTGSAESKLIKVYGCHSNFDGRMRTREELVEVAESLQHLVGKTIRVDGLASAWDAQNKPNFVMIRRQNQIKVVK